MLAPPERTPFELSFRLFGFPVRVHPLFWFGALLLGAGALHGGIEFLLIWVGVVFVSVLVHELGHALAYRACGRRSSIVLWMFGGLTVADPEVRTRTQKVLVSLAGPVAGFVLCGAVYLSHQATGWGSLRNGVEVAYLYTLLIFVNLYWGVLNLLPVFPLDGGQVARELCAARYGGRGDRVAFQLSFWTAVAVAVYGLVCELEEGPRAVGLLEWLPTWFPRGSLFLTLLFGLLAYQSYLLLRATGRGYGFGGWGDDRLPWER